MNWSKIRYEPYLICVYKFCKNAKFTKLKLRPVYGNTYTAVCSNTGSIDTI